jgi:hypothetical protein
MKIRVILQMTPNGSINYIVNEFSENVNCNIRTYDEITSKATKGF